MFTYSYLDKYMGKRYLKTYKGITRMTFENRRLIAFMAISILTILIPEILSKDDLRQEIVYDGAIVGYLPVMENYQVEFLDCTYEELQDKIELFKSEKGINTEAVSLNYYSPVTTMDNK